jgi:hypothetical protein
MPMFGGPRFVGTGALIRVCGGLGAALGSLKDDRDCGCGCAGAGTIGLSAGNPAVTRSLALLTDPTASSSPPFLGGDRYDGSMAKELVGQRNRPSSSSRVPALSSLRRLLRLHMHVAV